MIITLFIKDRKNDKMNLKDKVGQYYDETYKSYALGWSKEHLHHGFWDDDTQTHEESLVNTINHLVEMLDINSDDVILDAGCGVGGAAKYISNKFNCQVVGITNSAVLLEIAKSNISNSTKSKLEFHFMDYENTSFGSNSFTKIFGIESVCHAEDKSKFAKEAFRLLKSGGKILISDGYLIKNTLNEEENQIYNEFLEGWALPNLAKPEEFKKILTEGGFTNIKYIDKTDKIRKSLEYMHRNARFSRFPYYLLSRLKVIPKSRYLSAKSAYLAKISADRGINGYGFLYAEKS
jgi:cyclopropane fatty-acyl-phospholipid synthase-like methyltransferase